MLIPSLTLAPEQLMEAAQAAGAEAIEIYWFASHSRPVTFEGNRLKQLEQLESSGIALRVWQDGRCGLAVGCGPIDIDYLVEKAIALSTLSQPTEILLAEYSPPTWNLSPPDITVEILVEMGKAGIEQLRAIQPDVICNGELSYSADTTGLMNSRGLQCQFVDFNTDGYLGVEWVRGEDFLEVDSGQSISPRPEGAEGSLQPQLWVQAIHRRLQWGQQVVEVASGNYPAIVLPTAVAMLLDSVIEALDGRQLSRKASPWWDKQGARIATPDFCLTQMPLLGSYGVPFDDQGIATQSLDFIRDGVMQQGYCDLRFARKLGVEPTGNGFRGGLNSYPEPALFNAVLPCPSRSFPELLERMDTGLLIERVMGNCGDVSGEFSVSVELGYWVENGEIVGRVKDVMLAGNSYDLLHKIDAFGAAPDGLTSDGRDWAGAYCVPAVLVSELAAIARI